MPLPSETPTRWLSCRPSPVDDVAMIAPEWLDPETPPWTGPDAGLPTLYEYVESAGPFVGREGPRFSPAPSVRAPDRYRIRPIGLPERSRRPGLRWRSPPR